MIRGSPTDFGWQADDAQFRSATFIIPKTGERSTRSFTLREAFSRSRSSDEAATPLLGLFSPPRSGAASRDDGSSPPPTRMEYFKARARREMLRAQHFMTSRTGKAILKCSIAYALGSMATLVPAVSGLYGHKQDSKHLVATVTVYFHPARTIGSMHEATILALIAVAYAAFVAFSSMGVSVFLGSHDQLILGHILVLIVFVGGGLGGIALLKQRMGSPLVNVAASLAALGCITILVKEGSVQAGEFSHVKVVQILCMVVTGIVIATVVNFLLFPVLARKRLSNDLEKTTYLLGEMLVCITRAFLRGSEQDLSGEFYRQLNLDHQASLETMKQNLGEAKMEFLVIGKENIYDLNARLVACLDGLTQDLGGLRSAANAQFSFISQPPPESDTVSMPSHVFASPTATPSTEVSQYPGLDSISEAAEDDDILPNGKFTPEIYRGLREFRGTSRLTRSTPGDSPEPDTPQPGQTESTTPDLTDVYNSNNLAQSPGDMFLAFISRLGPPTKSLVYTLKQILDELPFRARPNAPDRWNPWVHQSVEVAINEQLRSSLHLAIDMYRETRKEALNALYQSRAMTAAVTAQQGSKSKFGQRSVPQPSSPDGRRSFTSQARMPFYRRQDEVLADIEEVSACCGHFSFSLLDFAEDVLIYLDILQELKVEMEAHRHSWNWLMFWQRSNDDKNAPQPEPVGSVALSTEPEPAGNLPVQLRMADAFGDVKRVKRPWYYFLHKALRVFRRDDITFATKVGIGAIVYAFPAFWAETRPFFVRWRGEWGLVTYMLVCCMTIGASNTTGMNRFIGTFIGSCLAVLAWIIANQHGVANPVVLGFLGWMVSLPCFYINIAKNDGPFCRFILLTYNLGALYSYSLSIHDDDNDDDEGGIDPAIWDIVVHRFVSVIAGIVWGLIISRVVWPVSARRKLTDGLSVLWLRMGLIFKRDPLATLLLGSPSNHYMDICEESELQSFLRRLKTLRKSASSEFELQGPFPDAVFGRILARTTRMLDAFHALNVIIRRNLQYTPGEAAVLRFTRAQRAAASARISHLFTVLASSIKLEYPLDDGVLPDIANSRDALLARISEFRRTGPGREVTTEQDYELLYAYILVTGQLAQDIQAVVGEIESIYGTLNEDNLKLE